MPLFVHEGDRDRRELAAEDLRKNIERSHVRRTLRQGEKINPEYVYRLWVEDQGFAHELYLEGLIDRLPGP